jgi:hypothetical protein
MDTTVINTIWRPLYGMLVRGLALLTPEWENLQKLENFKQLSNRSITWPVELVNGGGIAYTSDGGSTARASSNAPIEATDSWKHMTSRFEVGFDSMDAENDSRFASAQIEKQIRYQAADKLRSFRRAVAVNFYGHTTGHIFLAEGTASNPSSTYTKVRVKDLYGESGLAVPARIRDYVTINKDYMNIHSGTTSTVRDGGKISAIDETNNDITINTAADQSGTVTAGDALCLFNQVLSGSVDDQDLWMNGMLDLTRGTTVHNIATSAQPDWVAGVNQTSYGKSLNGTDAYKWFETISQRSDHKVQWGYTTIGAIASGGGTQLDQIRYGADPDTLALGFSKLVMMGVTLEGRPYVPAGYLFLGSNSALRKLSPDEAPKDVVDGGEKAGSFQQYTNRLGFYKDQVFRAQLTVVSRLGLGVVSGVTEVS